MVESGGDFVREVLHPGTKIPACDKLLQKGTGETGLRIESIDAKT